LITVSRLVLVMMMAPVPATAQQTASPETFRQISVDGLPLDITKLSYSDLDGWRETDVSGAFKAFRNTCRKLIEIPPHKRRLGLAVDDLLVVCHRALAQAGAVDAAKARVFFENHFDPVAIEEDRRERNGFFTGYFEPSVAASLTRTEDFSVPLYRQPDDLVKTKGRTLPDDWDPDIAYARNGAEGLRVYPDRAEIEAGYLDGRGLELAYVSSWIEAFFIHIQGSARLSLPDGSLIRLTFAAKNGRPYTSIGRLLVEAGTFDKSSMTMPALRQWLFDNPQEGLALMRKNASFIFFRESPGLRDEDGPVGAAGVPLLPGISLAVDRTWHLFGTPVWIDVAADMGENPTWTGHRGLMIAQDTGSAIIGPTRADIFVGTGKDAGTKAGHIKHEGRFITFRPKPAAALTDGDDKRP